MLKRNYMKLIIILGLVFLLSGCGWLYGPEETMVVDPPPVTFDPDLTNTTTDNSEQTTTQVNENTKKINLTIYFFDDQNDVVPLSLEIPKVEGLGKEVLKYMTKGGPAEELLPLGFSPILPEGTTFTTNIKESQKLMIVDFSKEFLNYQAASPAEEKKILDAITWSMTEFPTVEQVEIRVNGFVLEEMPVWKTPIIGPLSRVDGINLEFASNINFGQTSQVTLYFNRTTQSMSYLVPVTRLIPKTDNIPEATIEQLILGPKSGSDLTSAILPSTKLLGIDVSNDLLVADFNEEILGFNNQMSDELINMIIWSLTENTDIPTIQILIQGETAKLPNEMVEPIMRPKMINTTIF